MNTCRTCKFSAEPRVYPLEDDADDWEKMKHNSAASWHTCVRIIHGNTFPEVGSEHYSEDGGYIMDSNPKLLAVVTDGSGYAARLQVRPDFGCVLWESR